ncbi:MAG: hypothetical protein KDA38_05225, partial [Planctomycetales bacterium]|nr:hypothetical protein [Planctomycetales bacterium]
MGQRLLDALSEPACRQWTWTLLHFVWQGAAVSLLLLVVERCFRLRQVSDRYVLSVAALACMAACPLVTFCCLDARTTALPLASGPVAAFDSTAARAHEPKPAFKASAALAPISSLARQSNVALTPTA